MPTGVAARCFISTIVPTVPAPAGRWGWRTAPAAFSRRPTTNGVANTCAPRFPIACAVCSSATVYPTSAVAPASISMGSLYRGWRGDRKPVSSYAACRAVKWGDGSARRGRSPAEPSGEMGRWQCEERPVAGRALGGLAPTFGFLLAGRAVQGIAGGLVYGTAPALATLGAAPSLRGRRLGSLNAAIGLGFASGPAVAGVLIGALGWRAVFYARVPAALAALGWALA